MWAPGFCGVSGETDLVRSVFLYLGIKMKVLLISGSDDLSKTISIILKVRWPELSLLRSIEERESIEQIYRELPDIVMLNLDSGNIDHFDIIGQIRSFSPVPLIVLSSSDDVMDKIRALEMGADDWIHPSAIPMEFIAKVNAVLRRCINHSNNHFQSFLHGKLSIDHDTHQVCVSGKTHKLTPIEYKLLSLLVNNEGRVVTRADLLHTIWGPDYRADPAFLKKYIHSLRSKLEEHSSNPEIILNERGVGYIFTPHHDSTN